MAAMKKLSFVLCFLFLLGVLQAQILSPDLFLGYKIGDKYTPHWRIVAYFQHVAAQVPGSVKLQQYGHTNEGRPLMVAIIASPENMNRLEAIRQANISGNVIDNAPAIVWLSYNVHGNETSSSEASMLTLFSLADPSNRQAKEWLRNTVVVMDPCLNPDGRDRYVNWFNSVVGEQYNADPIAREHREPWPGGRFNHYYFDLNRDWAWQTQIESRHRAQLYLDWLPQIHVDFHEQGINSPYYFAPAAEPLHEVITPWQRDFQKTIGRNHARYFDERGWLYFTREQFDLLYPSYGDTYPTYNGAIGMTYEQAGGGVAGLGITTATGDTLTLRDRALHHHTTGLSTVEVSSAHAGKLLAEFKKFMADAKAGRMNAHQAYVIKTAESRNVAAFLDLLKKNRIEYYAARSGSARGYNYHSGREESFSTDGSDIVVPAAQQQGALLRVLFDYEVKLSDTATYDITAWALPYAYGLKAYATREKIATDLYTPPTNQVQMPADAYGFVAPWDGVHAAKFLAQLLKNNIRVRVTQEPFTSGGKQYPRGSLLILKNGNQQHADLWSKLRGLAAASSVKLEPVQTGMVEKGFDFGSSNVRHVARRRVAVLTGEGVNPLSAGTVWHFFDQQIQYPATLINTTDLNRMHWHEFDVVVMPSGNYRFLTDKNAVEQMRNWISQGGQLIAIDDAVAQLAGQEWSLKSRKVADTTSTDPYDALRRYENRERDPLSGYTPGAIFRVELDNSHPLAFGYPSFYYTLKQDDRLYDFMKEGGWNVGVIKKDKQLSGFVGSRLQRHLKDGLIFGVQEIGRGNAVYLSDDVLFRSFWENGKLMFANAVFMVGQ